MTAFSIPHRPFAVVRRVTSTLPYLLRNVALAGLVACDSAHLLEPPPSRAELAWFTPQIAAQVNASGQLPGTVPEFAQTGDLSSTQAASVAARFLKEFGTAASGEWTKEAGYPVQASALLQCGRIDFLESPYDTIPKSTPAGLKTQVGGAWLVRYCANGSKTAVEFYIGASGMESMLEPDGSFRPNTPLVGISTRAINRSTPEDETSEDAAGEIFRGGRGVIASLPRIRRFGVGYVPWYTTWSADAEDKTGGRTTVIARVTGSTRKWTLRAPVTQAGADTLAYGDGLTTKYIFRRRSDAITRAELEQQFGSK